MCDPTLSRRGLAFALHCTCGMRPTGRGLNIFVVGVALFGGAIAYGQDANRVARPAPAPAQNQLPRLTGQERVREYWKDLVNPLSFVESGASGGWGLLRDRPHEWKEGGAGFGRRYASSFGQHLVQSTILFGVAGALHEDNRYVPCANQSFGSRLVYALESTVESRDRNGNRRVSYSKIGAMAGASAISRLWQPESTGGPANGAVSFGTSLALAAGLNVVREFVPRLNFLTGAGRN